MTEQHQRDFEQQAKLNRMTTPNAKPRAGEHTAHQRAYTDLQREYMRALTDRDALAAQNREAVELLGKLLDVAKRANIEVPMSDAPVFFAARELLAKHGR